VPGNALYFTTLEKIRGNLSNADILSKGTINLFSGISARVFAGTIMMPITVLKSRFESDLYQYKTIRGATLQILRMDGMKGLFSGLMPTLLRDAPYAGIYVYFYEGYKSYLNQQLITSNSTWITILAGGLGGISATLLTQPFDLIKTRMQLQPKEYRGFIQSIFMIFQVEFVLY
jgi:solute carrier family 25 protein 38